MKILSLTLLSACVACSTTPREVVAQAVLPMASQSETPPSVEAEEIIVAFTDKLDELQKTRILRELGIEGSFEERGHYDLLKTSSNLVDTLRVLNDHPKVKYAEPNSRYRPHVIAK